MVQGKQKGRYRSVLEIHTVTESASWPKNVHGVPETEAATIGILVSSDTLDSPKYGFCQFL